jgi:hypothetical protein
VRTNKSAVVNPYDTTLQMVVDGNLNIKENMKASYGIIFKEGKAHNDQGPSYLDSIKSENGMSRTKLTL